MFCRYGRDAIAPRAVADRAVERAPAAGRDGPRAARRGCPYPAPRGREPQPGRLDTLQAKLGAAQRAVAEAQGALEAREQQLAAMHQTLAGARTGRLDPVLLRRSRHWLAGEREQVAAQQRQLEQLKAERDERLAEYRAQQAKLEGLQQHRAEHQAEYVQDAQRRAAAAADSDWLARRGTAAGSAE